MIIVLKFYEYFVNYLYAYLVKLNIVYALICTYSAHLRVSLISKNYILHWYFFKKYQIFSTLFSENKIIIISSLILKMYTISIVFRNQQFRKHSMCVIRITKYFIFKTRELIKKNKNMQLIATRGL